MCAVLNSPYRVKTLTRYTLPVLLDLWEMIEMLTCLYRSLTLYPWRQRSRHSKESRMSLMFLKQSIVSENPPEKAKSEEKVRDEKR